MIKYNQTTQLTMILSARINFWCKMDFLYYPFDVQVIDEQLLVRIGVIQIISVV